MGAAAELCKNPIFNHAHGVAVFSPNRAIAPVFFASSRVMISVTTGRDVPESADQCLTLIFPGVMAEKW